MQEKSKIELFQLENGLTVPTFEGLFFCSRRNPLSEADSWALANKKKIESDQKLIILGLGAGFHMQHLKDRPETYVIELREELIQAWEKYNPHFKVHFIEGDGHDLQALPMDFRPAWSGRELSYEKISRDLRGVCKSALQDEAQRNGFPILADALKNTSLPEQLDLTVKDIAGLFPQENQTSEARIWRALREFVA